MNDGYGTQIRCLNPNDLRGTVSKTMLDNLGSQPVVTSLYKQWWIERLDECKELRQSAELNPREIPATTRVMFQSNEALRAFSNTTDHSLEQSRGLLDRFIMSEPAKHSFETHIKTPGTYVNNRSEMSIFALITGPIHITTQNGVEVYSPLSGRDSVSHQILDPERPQFTDQERIDYSNGIDHVSTTKPDRALQKRFVYLQNTGESHYQKFIPTENGEE